MHCPSTSIRSSCHYYSRPSNHHPPPLIGSWIDWALILIISTIYICQHRFTPALYPQKGWPIIVLPVWLTTLIIRRNMKATSTTDDGPKPNHRSFRRRAGLIDRLISAVCRSIYDPNCCVRHTLLNVTQEQQEPQAGHPAIDFDLFDEVDQSRRNNIMYSSQSHSSLSNLWPTPTHQSSTPAISKNAALGAPTYRLLVCLIWMALMICTNQKLCW